MKTWHDLLNTITRVRKEPTKYGPHTRELGSAIAVLQDAEWYASVGTPSPLDERVVRLGSWDEAWAVLDDPPGYFRGVLVRPADLVMAARKADPQTDEWWHMARGLFEDAVTVDNPPTEGWKLGRRAKALDYLTWTFERLLEEIIVADRVDCTYFREQLQWFAAGYFPCGWEGDWPVGKMRVY